MSNRQSVRPHKDKVMEVGQVVEEREAWSERGHGKSMERGRERGKPMEHDRKW